MISLQQLILMVILVRETDTRFLIAHKKRFQRLSDDTSLQHDDTSLREMIISAINFDGDVTLDRRQKASWQLFTKTSNIN